MAARRIPTPAQKIVVFPSLEFTFLAIGRKEKSQDYSEREKRPERNLTFKFNIRVQEKQENPNGRPNPETQDQSNQTLNVTQKNAARRHKLGVAQTHPAAP